MAAVLAAEDGVGLGHGGLDEGVSDPGPHRAATELADDLGHGPTGDQVVDHGGSGLATQLAGRDQRGERRRVHGPAPLVHDEAAVGVAVEGQPDVGLLGDHPALQSPHLEVYADYDKKGPMYAAGAAYYQLLSSAGMCVLFFIMNTAPLPELIAAATGWNFDWDEALKAGRRILHLRQAFNAREGLAPSDFKLPERVSKPKAPGELLEAEVDFEALKRGLFAEMGWDYETGKPFRQTMIDMGLDELTRDLEEA